MSFDTQSNLVASASVPVKLATLVVTAGLPTQFVAGITKTYSKGSGFIRSVGNPKKRGLMTNSCESYVRKAAFRQLSSPKKT